MNKEKLILELAQNKVDELKNWKKVRYEGGRVYYETMRITHEIKNYPKDLQLLYLKYILEADFIIQDNLPSTAPDVTQELKGWVKKKIVNLKLLDATKDVANLVVKQKNDVTNKIFISHSSKDVKIVKSFVEKVLRLGLDIPAERVFCSSLEGFGIKSGQYMPDRLKEEINKSCLAILFISTNYKDSEICLNEVGAAWATLDKECVIPMLLPSVSFEDLGFLDLNRLGIRISQRNDIIKFVQDCKVQLNPNCDLQKLHVYIEDFLTTLNSVELEADLVEETISQEDNTEWNNCFSRNLYPFSTILRKAVPALNDGIHKIDSPKLQKQILIDLSKAKFLETFWYKCANGDYYVKKLIHLSSGNWLISSINWEVKISEMWICMDLSPQYEFILIKSEKQDPYKIDSDVGGDSYNIGILNDGTIVSQNELINGYAIINDESITLAEKEVEPRFRNNNAHWIFLVSSYHKAGYNADETIGFCKKLDAEEIAVNETNIMKFLKKLRNHPTVLMYN